MRDEQKWSRNEPRPHIRHIRPISDPFTNVTIVDNTATSGAGGIYISGTLELYNTIVVNNTSGGPENNVVGTLSSLSSHNLLRQGSSGGLIETNGNILLDTLEDAGLASLGNYGGPTKTHKLVSGSRAIDAGDDALALALGLLFDQRGSNRQEDGDGDLVEHVDIGAFELAADEYFGGL